MLLKIATKVQAKLPTPVHNVLSTQLLYHISQSWYPAKLQNLITRVHHQAIFTKMRPGTYISGSLQTNYRTTVFA